VDVVTWVARGEFDGGQPSASQFSRTRFTATACSRPG
jgi:hypothetical protein